MTMDQRPMTTETKLKLLKQTEERIEDTTKAIDVTRELIKRITEKKSSFEENDFNSRFDTMITSLEFRLFIGILNLDLTSAIRIYLNAKFHYEGVYSARQIFVIISEGYKKLYSFVKKDKNGHDNLSQRNNSFWKKDIGQIIKNKMQHLQSDYDSITKKLDEYLTINFEQLNDLRNLSIHYGKSARDKSPISVFDMIAKIDIDDTFRKMIPFLEILNEMFLFTHLMVKRYDKNNEMLKEINKK